MTSVEFKKRAHVKMITQKLRAGLLRRRVPLLLIRKIQNSSTFPRRKKNPRKMRSV